MSKIETNTMQDWSNRINTLNQEAKELLTTMEENIKKLEECWDGNSSNSFINATLSLTSKAIDHHITMKETSNILNEIVNRMNEQ